jgi:hypothetical protein
MERRKPLERKRERETVRKIEAVGRRGKYKREGDR